MNTINMPGFAAEASLYKTRGHYRLKASWADGAGEPGVFAQQIELECPAKGCGRCIPDPTSSKGGRKCCCFPARCIAVECEPTVTCGPCVGFQQCSDGTQKPCSV
jgi:hypothetical protein